MGSESEVSSADAVSRVVQGPGTRSNSYWNAVAIAPLYLSVSLQAATAAPQHLDRIETCLPGGRRVAHARLDDPCMFQRESRAWDVRNGLRPRGCPVRT